MSLQDVLTETGSTTLTRVATTPNSTCYFSACYSLYNIPPSLRFFVRPTSCVVQLPYTSPSYLIKPTSSGDRTISTALIFSYTPAPQIQPSQLITSSNQGSYDHSSPSSLPSVSSLPLSYIVTTVTHVMVTTHVDMIPSFTDITPSHVDMTASYVDIPPSSLSTNLKTTCTFLRCTPGYVTISIMATISFALLFLVTAIVSRFIQRYKMALMRYAVMYWVTLSLHESLYLLLIICGTNVHMW